MLCMVVECKVLYTERLVLYCIDKYAMYVIIILISTEQQLHVSKIQKNKKGME